MLAWLGVHHSVSSFHLSQRNCAFIVRWPIMVSLLFKTSVTDSTDFAVRLLLSVRRGAWFAGTQSGHLKCDVVRWNGPVQPRASVPAD